MKNHDPRPDPIHPPKALCAALLAVAALAMSACAGTAGPASGPADTNTDIVIDRDLTYVDRPDGALQVDVYRPRTGIHPGVVVVHPGGWISGSKADVERLATQLARAGYVAVAASYRLAPEHRYPAQIHDLKEAVRWMRVHADRLGLDPTRIAAFGYSAGGHLAALLATSDADDGLEGETTFPGVSSRVQALVAGGTPTDLRSLSANPAVSRLLGGTAGERPVLAADASPIRFVSRDDPPSFLYHGHLDFFIPTSQARQLHDAFARDGVPTTLSFNRLGHFGNWLFGRTQEQRAIAFLDRWLGEGDVTRVAQVGDLR